MGPEANRAKILGDSSARKTTRAFRARVAIYGNLEKIIIYVRIEQSPPRAHLPAKRRNPSVALSSVLQRLSFSCIINRNSCLSDRGNCITMAT